MLTALQNASMEAVRLGHQWVGPEHVLLAILDDRFPSTARAVLNDLGVTHADFEEQFLASLLNCKPPIRSAIAQGASVHPAPIFYEIQGWVAGFAAANGAPASTEVVLLALCCLRHHTFAAVIDRLDVVAGLSARGVAVNEAHIPTDRVMPATSRLVDVPIDKLDEVVAELVAAGSLLGFNTDAENGEAWVIVDDNV